MELSRDRGQSMAFAVGNFQPNYATTGFYGAGLPVGNSTGVFQSQGLGGLNPFMGTGMNILGMMFQLMSGMNQLVQGWGGFAGGGQQFQSQFGGYGGGTGQFIDYASMNFPNLANYTGQSAGTTTSTGGAYGSTGTGGTGGSVALPTPSDPQEFASYIQAQIAGGALQGKTGVAQADAIPGSRFGQVQDSTMWQASLARNYAYQFAAQAVGANPLSADGLAAGANAFGQMKPEAQLFMQVASVFKGNLMGGPGFYDNPGLKNLLESKGLGQFVNDPQVGQTDVQTIGAVAAAINSGQLSLNDVINSGTISDLNRYNQVIGYVSQGGFAADLNRYDTVQI